MFKVFVILVAIYATYVTACNNGEFACASTGICVPDSWRCNGINNCGDSSDEADCWPTCRPDRFFQCVSSGECIIVSWRCDGDEDCSDASDEHGCDGADTYQDGEAEEPGSISVCTLHVYPNKALVGFDDVSYPHWSLQECKDECIRLPECRSLNYAANSRMCVFSRESHATQPSAFENESGTLYFEKVCFEL